jgi:hypothetical protein
VNPAATAKVASTDGRHHHRSSSGTNTTVAGQPAPSNSVGAVQSRNGGASICSGLPSAYNPGG